MMMPPVRVAIANPVDNPVRMLARQDGSPWSVVPKREFHGFEMRAVGKTARVPGERLGAVIVGVELIDAEPVVGRGGKSDNEGGAEHGRGQHQLGINARGSIAPTLEKAAAGLHRIQPVAPAATIAPSRTPRDYGNRRACRQFADPG